jgi:hypothetical protein
MRVLDGALLVVVDGGSSLQPESVVGAGGTATIAILPCWTVVPMPVWERRIAVSCLLMFRLQGIALKSSHYCNLFGFLV